MSTAPSDTGARSEPTHESGSGPLVAFLVFGVGLFVIILTGYVLVRLNDPAAYSWAPTLLNRRLGWASAAVLLASCLGGGWAIRSALAGKRRAARAWLAAALFAGACALGMRAIELPAISRQAGWTMRPTAQVAAKSGPAPASQASHVGDPSQGKRIYLGTCAACHAPDGSGVKGQGFNLKTSVFLNDKTDQQALAFVKAGRQPFDPESKLHLAMPARGGNPALTDANLLDAIAYVRELQKQPAAPPPAAAGSSVASTSGAPARPSSDQPQWIDGELWLPHSVVPAAAIGPAGTVASQILLQKPGGEGRAPQNVRRFFSMVLFVTGLHSLYLLFALLLGVRELIAGRGVSDRAPGLNLAGAAAYWVAIGAIGALIIPAFYT